MTLEGLILKNGGKRPLQHWECLRCSECCETETKHCPRGCGPMVKVKIYNDADIKLARR